jgi:CheY-like chemotaxis protein
MDTILVVDDNLYVVEVFVAMLEEGGYRTFSAYSGEECLEVLKQVKPDLLLLDIMMKPMDGWKTLEKIKGNPDTEDTPILMLTSKQLTLGEMEKYGVYIEDYVLKPVTNFELYDAVSHVIYRRQTIRSSMERARQCGIDYNVVNEYAQLSKSIDINKRFIKIFETINNATDAKVGVSDNMYQALKKLNDDIRFQETRLHQIEEKIRIP